MPSAAMIGCSANATMSSGTACQRFPSRMRELAMRINAVARLRGCKCWSAMFSAVPATGSVNMAATIARAGPLGSPLGKNLPRDPLARPKDEKQRDELPAQLRPGQRNSRPMDEVSHPPSKSVACNWNRKNSALWG